MKNLKECKEINTMSWYYTVVETRFVIEKSEECMGITWVENAAELVFIATLRGKQYEYAKLNFSRKTKRICQCLNFEQTVIWNKNKVITEHYRRKVRGVPIAWKYNMPQVKTIM